MSDDDTGPVNIEDGLTDTQRQGAALAAAGWQGVDIAAELGVRPETVSRWRRLPAWLAAVESYSRERRAKLNDRAVALAGDALAELESLLHYGADPHIRLRAAVSVLTLTGFARTAARQSGREEERRGGGIAATGTA